MAWSVVHSINAAPTVSGSTAPVTLSWNTTTGNSLIVAALCTGGVTITGMSLSAGSGTFAKAIAQPHPGSGATEIWIAPNITGGTTPTVTITYSSTAATSVRVAVYEASGGDSGGATDGTAGAAANPGALSVGPITTTANGDLVVKAFWVAGNCDGAVQSGWTEINPDLHGNAFGYIVQGAAGSITGTDTPSDNFTGAIAAFKPAGAATLHFAMAIVDTSSVSALGLEVQRHFPLQVADTTIVLALGLEVRRRFSVQIADTTAVRLTYGLRAPNYPVLIADTSAVFVGFENDHATLPLAALTVPPYAGQDQGARINVPARIAYKYIDWEEGPWVMPPYAIFYPGPPPMVLPMRYAAQAQARSVGWIRWVAIR